MTRTIAALRPVWDATLGLTLLLVAVDVATLVVPGASSLDLPWWIVAGAIGLLVVLMLLIGVAPHADVEEPVELAAPVRGRWVAMNSPGQRVPSHGTRTRGQLAAIDLCGPPGDGSPPLVRTALRGSRPEEFACFGRPILSMGDGVVVRVRDGRRDHRARNTWQALLLMVTVEGLLREVCGTGAVLGNHVVIDHGDGTFAAYAHLQRASATVAEGERVEAGALLGRVGATGNTSAPHLHVQLMDRADIDAAAGIPVRWRGVRCDGVLDPELAARAEDRSPSAVAGMPRNGEVLEVFAAPPRP